MFSLNKLPQWGGAAFMFGNLLFLVNKLNEMSRLFLSKWIPDVISGQNTLIIILGQLALIGGYVTFLWLYDRRLGRFGKISLRMFCIGGGVLAFGHVSFIKLFAFETAFILVLIGLGVMLLGLIIFGIINLQQRVLACWQWLPLLTGLMGLIGFFILSGEEISAIFLLFRTLFALGLIGLGFTMWLEKPVPLKSLDKNEAEKYAQIGNVINIVGMIATMLLRYISNLPSPIIYDLGIMGNLFTKPLMI
jgi:hypothetical protein